MEGNEIRTIQERVQQSRHIQFMAMAIGKPFSESKFFLISVKLTFLYLILKLEHSI